MNELLVLFFAFALVSPAFGGTTAGPSAEKPQSTSDSTAGVEPLDYSTLSHTLSIESLRAGTHDESGRNIYNFKVSMFGLINTAEERNLDWSKRRKVTTELGVFGETKIDSLAIWRPDEKTKDLKELRIEGHAIRELAARSMNEFKISESELAVAIEIEMQKHAKRYFVLGNDTLVAKTIYYPIPPTKFDTPLRSNQSLVIADDKGTSVKLQVRYDKPATQAQAQKAPPNKKP